MSWTEAYLKHLPGAFFFRHWRGFLLLESVCRDMMEMVEGAALARSQYFPPETIRSCRDIEYIHLPDGSLLHVWRLTPILFRFVDYISNMQIIQDAPDRISINIVPHGVLTDETKKEIEAMCADILKGRIDFRVMLVPEIPRGADKKRKLLICNV